MASHHLPACHKDANSNTLYFHITTCFVKANSTAYVQNTRPSFLAASSLHHSHGTSLHEVCICTFNSTTASPSLKLRLIM